MSNNQQGFDYENVVIESLKKAGVAGNIKTGAGASSTAADADFIVDGETYLLEVKSDLEAQMGGTSVRYNDGEFEIVSDAVDKNTASLIISLKPSASSSGSCTWSSSEFRLSAGFRPSIPITAKTSSGLATKSFRNSNPIGSTVAKSIKSLMSEA